MKRALILLLLAVGLVAQTPLNTPGGSYLGHPTGLYEGSNALPADHALVGQQRAAMVQPLDVAGQPSTSGRIVWLSIGMSNTSQETCCIAQAFAAKVAGMSGVNPALRIVNGAASYQVAGAWWDSPAPWNGASYAAQNYARIANLLAAQGLSAQQVQVVWLKVANPFLSSIALPLSSGSPNADAYLLLQNIGGILRRLKVQYPRLQQVFISSRIYSPGPNTLSPEPYAHESGFAVKWAIDSQVKQMRGALPDPRAGDLNYNSTAPWIGWGPYLWANGATANPEGLAWMPGDVSSDNVHPTSQGVEKVAARLVAHFSQQPWFTGSTVPPPVVLSLKQQIQEQIALAIARLNQSPADVAGALVAIGAAQVLVGSLQP